MSLSRRLWLYGPALGYCVFIFFLSNESSLPATPGGDLVAHFCAYTLMGVLFLRAVALSTTWTRAKVFSWSAVMAALYGVSDEFHQSFVPGRFATVEDTIADALGAAFGAFCALFLYEKIRSGGWRFRFER